MLFPTIDFAIFFFILYFVTWQLNNRWRKFFLLAASYFFYAYWNWLLALLLLSVSVMNFLFGMLLGRFNDDRTRKFLVRLAVVANLGVLFYNKYFEFFLVTVNNLLLGAGAAVQLTVWEVVLPVGISFFTFQAMSYVIDVYRKVLPADYSLVDVLLYISFFPQLVAGPIVRASDFLPQLKQLPAAGELRADRAFLLVTAGLFKKIVIANYLATLFVDPVFEHPAAFAPLELLLGVYGYAVQIYCDFSAYSDIAIGIALLLGYNFMKNFDHPYRAVGLRDFWRRWHISLSTWLRDYLYIPLGGSRKGKLRTFANLFLTMLLGGIWHGANWQFVIWGILHGLGLCVERLIAGLLPARPEGKKPSLVLRALGVLVTFHFVCLGWVFFRASSLEIACEYLRVLFTGTRGVSILTPFIITLISAGLVVHFLPAWLSGRLRNAYNRLPLVVQGLAFGAFLVILGALSPEGVAPFIYFQF